MALINKDLKRWEKEKEEVEKNIGYMKEGSINHLVATGYILSLGKLIKHHHQR